jgi:hypothetical protein
VQLDTSCPLSIGVGQDASRAAAPCRTRRRSAPCPCEWATASTGTAGVEQAIVLVQRDLEIQNDSNSHDRL